MIAVLRLGFPQQIRIYRAVGVASEKLIEAMPRLKRSLQMLVALRQLMHYKSGYPSYLSTVQRAIDAFFPSEVNYSIIHRVQRTLHHKRSRHPSMNTRAY